MCPRPFAHVRATGHRDHTKRGIVITRFGILITDFGILISRS
jgi:hypothetical protein